MPFTVFYAWQSDTSDKLNRNFIEGAIKKAIKKVKAESGTVPAAIDMKLEIAPALEPDVAKQIEEPVEESPDDFDILFQVGARGEPGAPIIAEAILQRISDSGVFIADITPTTTVKTFDNRTKKVPNANVLIEVGAASRTGRGWDRILLVMNTARASVDELPFDLRHRHCQASYKLDSWDDIDRAQKARGLSDIIASQLSIMYRKCRDIGGRNFSHKGLVVLNILYISLRQTLIGWDEVEALTLDADRVRAWATKFDSQMAGLCREILDAVGPDSNQEELSILLSSIFTDIKAVSKPFDWDEETEKEAIADAARSFVSNYEVLCMRLSKLGLRLIPSNL